MKHDNWTDEPIIGRVLETKQKTDDVIQVRWYDGKYTRRWKPSRERKSGEYVPWIDNVSGKQVLLNFKITTIEEFKLDDKIIQILKTKYSQRN